MPIWATQIALLEQICTKCIKQTYYQIEHQNWMKYTKDKWKTKRDKKRQCTCASVILLKKIVYTKINEKKRIMKFDKDITKYDRPTHLVTTKNTKAHNIYIHICIFMNRKWVKNKIAKNNNNINNYSDVVWKLLITNFATLSPSELVDFSKQDTKTSNSLNTEEYVPGKSTTQEM